MKNDQLVILIPAYNEELRIGSVLNVVCQYKRNKRVIVIDDGSEDNTAKIAQQYSVEVLRHPKNRGKGAALQTGINYVGDSPLWLFLDADLIDLNHQHMEALLEPVSNDDAGMTIGMFQQGGKLGVDLAQRFFGILNGQRGLSGEFVNSLPDLSWARFGVEVFLSRVALYKGISVAMPILKGITHYTKEGKFGLIPGACYRLQMFRECLYALFNWKKFV